MAPQIAKSSNTNPNPLVFCFDENKKLASDFACKIQTVLSPLELRLFPDDEIKVRSLTSVQDRDILLVGSVSSDTKHSIHDILCRLIFLCGDLHDHGARSISLLIPYLGYSRKDRRTKDLDPLTSRYIAQLLEVFGTTQIFTLDPHNDAAFQNSFRVNAHSLSAATLFADEIAKKKINRSIVIFSPDFGGLQRCIKLGKILSEKYNLSTHLGYISKERNHENPKNKIFAGDVKEKTVIILDDLISTGSTLAQAIQACKTHQAAEIIVIATHALFFAGIPKPLVDTPPDELIVTNSLSVMTSPAFKGIDFLKIIDLSDFLADLFWNSNQV